MKLTTFLMFLLGMPLMAQDPTVTVKASAGLVEKSVTFMIRPTIRLSGFICDKTELEAGDSSTCVVTLNRPARSGGYTIKITLPVELTGPTEVVVGQGLTSASFKITYPETSARATSILPTIQNIGKLENNRAIAEIMIPCCARLDHCGIDNYSNLHCIGE